MTYEDAKRYAHVRSGIYRTGDPVRVYTQEDADNSHPALREVNQSRVGEIEPKVYWKNHPVPLDERVPDVDKLFGDWEEYDPREQPECSAFNEMPA